MCIRDRVSIVLVTAAVVVFAINVPAVGDKGELPRSLPELFIPHVPPTWDCLLYTSRCV